MFPCILLAAGSSSRMGTNKMLLPFPPGSGTAMVQASASAALGAGCGIYLVVGCQGERVAALFRDEPRVRIVFNPGWESGMVGSIQAGLRVAIAGTGDRRGECARIGGIFVHHGDMPLADGSAFLRIGEIALGRAQAGLPQVPVFAGFNGEPGHPVLIPAGLFSSILGLEPDGSLKPFLLARQGMVAEGEDPRVIQDIDTPADYVRLAPH